MNDAVQPASGDAVSRKELIKRWSDLNRYDDDKYTPPLAIDELPEDDQSDVMAWASELLAGCAANVYDNIVDQCPIPEGAEGRYREALEEMKNLISISDGCPPGFYEDAREILDQALSPSGEQRAMNFTEREQSLMLGWYWLIKKMSRDYQTSEEENYLLDKLIGINSPNDEQPKETPLESLEQAIRDYDITQGGDSATSLIAWLESVTSFEYSPRKIKYAIKLGSEYMRERYGSDCFTDDLGQAVLFDSHKAAASEMMGKERIVVVLEDEEGGLLEEDGE